MKWCAVCFVVMIFVLSSACSGKKAEYIAELEQLKRTSDSVAFDLKNINVYELKALLTQSGEGLESMRQSIGNDDTLDLEFARMLERYYLAYRDLEILKQEIDLCKAGNKIADERIRLFKKDIEFDSGDRTDYEKNIRTETRELTKIRNHSIELKRRFEKAKSAIEQFQPEIERYLQQNVPSSP
ncbi:MAG: hypothetical protein A3D31_15890 [Candidatus Fluviicola riflensis]|nr:MAG: hypothetical protein CHH17_00825 [Candidatus Fluviicola riflensis]OGS78440.1 MAG: hypothetical protein A3D31_15890 [Candidatus Fluviicola riflensis]OGS85506.1 MAG: hypothetical protein A2724_12825 [Fluviicola sp. RIFCSPHIGHO2_01_FULL_43_53]OGS87547.1 MAG: hypothetical protein A3E30_09245 [Fluviicola sp. RIFCSPHIGHO2_12_FULL_43_24]